MQVSVEENGELARKIRVEIPETRILGELEKKFAQLMKTARLPGFRPGKVPLKILKNRHGSSLRGETVNEIIRQTLQDALSQKDLQPVGMPQIDDIHADAGHDLRYTASFDIYPQIALCAMDKLELERVVCDLTEADLDKMILNLRQQHRTLAEINRPAAQDDVLNIDFAGTIDGKPFAGGEAKGYEITLGSGHFIPGFEEQLIGTQAGDDIEFETVFPATYQATHLQGKAVVFKVHINTVNETALPALEDDFFRLFGIAEGGLTAFRAAMQRNMAREAETLAKQKTKNAVLDVLYQQHTFMLPEVLLQREVDNLVAHAKQQGVDAAQMQQDALKTQAERRVSLQLIIGEIIQQQDLQATQQQVREKLETMAQNYADPKQFMDWANSNKQQLADAEALVLEDNLVDFILSQAVLTERELSFDELTHSGQTGQIKTAID